MTELSYYNCCYIILQTCSFSALYARIIQKPMLHYNYKQFSHERMKKQLWHIH